ncbi:MAG: DUF1599 domain-containing protein [Flavobacteriales bacterium]
MPDTSKQYDAIIAKCREIFLKKQKDYGTSWRVLRTSSITDLIFIKARRIRVIEESGHHKVNEGIEPEYIGIVNYAIMGLIQLSLPDDAPVEMSPGEIIMHYDEMVTKTKQLMLDKNHDYGEAWRDMRARSFTDMILMRIQRIKQIEDNKGLTTVSEGVDANYKDMLNYAVFALIKMNEGE